VPGSRGGADLQLARTSVPSVSLVGAMESEVVSQDEAGEALRSRVWASRPFHAQ